MPSPRQRRRVVQVTLALGAAALLCGTWALYTRPEFLVMLANQVWACF